MKRLAGFPVITQHRPKPRRWRDVGIVLLGAAIGAVLFLARAKHDAIGATRSLESSVVASDRSVLACAGDVRLRYDAIEYGCRFDGARQPVSTPTEALQPFVTSEGELVVLGGVFRQPALKRKLESANARKARRRRFRCTVLVLDRRPMAVRFAPDGEWDQRSAVIVGVAQRCKLLD